MHRDDGKENGTVEGALLEDPSIYGLRLDAGRSVVWANGPARKRFGDAVVGAGIWDLIRATPTRRETLMKALERGEPRNLEFLVPGGDLEPRRVRFFPEGEGFLVVGTMDCDEQRLVADTGLRLSREMADLVRRLHQMNADVEALRAVGEREILRRQRLEEELEHRVEERTEALVAANAKLEEARQRFEALFQRNPSPMALCDFPTGRFLDINLAFVSTTGFAREEIMGRLPSDLGLAVYPEAHVAAGAELCAEGRLAERELKVRRKDGTVLDGLFSGEVLRVGGERLLLTVMVDQTERKAHEAERARLHTELLHAQKVEAVGRLAGGVAHDFNNFLAIMLLQLEQLREQAGLPAEARAMIGELETEAVRAAGLTRQLLLYSRKAVMERAPLDLSRLVSNLLKMLRRVIGENYPLRFSPVAEFPMVRADAGMIDQVILNLVINARDAMPDGGVIEIVLSVDTRRDGGAGDGGGRRWARLDVTDQGGGIAPEILGRIFEPFFTTKERGKGTGLGLSTVEGIVTQHDGWVEVASKPGEGSRFSVFLPLVEEQEPERVSPPSTVPVRGTGTILLAEDDRALTRAMTANLRAAGFSVLAAEGHDQALALAAESTAAVDLLLADVVMTGKQTGVDLVRRMRADHPGLPCLLMSGYSSVLSDAVLATLPGVRFIQKPFSRAQLLAAISETLARAHQQP